MERCLEWFKVPLSKSGEDESPPGVRISPSPQKETSESERWEEARAEGAGVGKRARRFATNWDGTGVAKCADLSLFRI